MTAPEQLARYRMSRARDALSEADALVNTAHFIGAQNRLYYAAFYAARALLALKRLDSSRHSGVIALFQQHFVGTNAVDADVARVLPRAFAQRLDSDYGDFSTVTEDDVKALRADVVTFLDVCERALSQINA